jgi:hypothetical protein
MPERDATLTVDLLELFSGLTGFFPGSVLEALIARLEVGR